VVERRDSRVPDPITGTVIAKAIGEAGSENATVSSNLILRILGPAADEFGQALSRSIAYRTRNFGRIADKAAKKASADLERGIVNPRVAYVLLDEGSLCDDELMAEYLGGVLAGSRTPDGRDDRAVMWSRVITGLSAFQVRAHYLLYREWADRLHGVEGVTFFRYSEFEQASLTVDAGEFQEVLVGDRVTPRASAIANHAIIGLHNAGLISNYSVAERPKAKLGGVTADLTLTVIPSLYGMELYAWAQGMPDMIPRDFTSEAVVFEAEDPIPRLTRVLLPNLLDQAERQGAPESRDT